VARRSERQKLLGNSDGIQAIGQVYPSLRREDGPLVRGSACFGDDVVLPQALHVVFVRSAQAHAKILSIEVDAARRQPGVVAVVSAMELGSHVMPAVNPVLAPLEPYEFAVLPRDAVHYVGQPVVAVVAKSLLQARQAAAQVVLKLQPQPPILDWQPDASPFARASFQKGSCPTTPPTAQSDLYLPRVAAAPLEPRHCAVKWNTANQSISVWIGSQTPSRAQADIAVALGLSTDRVHIMTPDVGGAFGSRASVSPEELALALLARHLESLGPSITLRWRSTRSEDFVAGPHGRGSRLQGALWITPQGRVLGLRAQLHFTLGAWLPYSSVVPLRNATRILPGPYAIHQVDIQGVATRSHAAPVGIYRGAGRPEAAILMETLIEQSARRVGIDPMQCRKENLIRSDAMPYMTATGEQLDSGDYAALLDRACERFNYSAERHHQSQRRQQGEWVGIGAALYVEPCGKGWESARVDWFEDGRIRVASGAPAQGQGHATTYAQLTAKTLGCDLAQVDVIMGDSQYCPQGIGALASRSIAIGGSAILQACNRLLQMREQGQPLPLSAEEIYLSQEAWASGCVIVRLCIDAETGAPSIERLVWVDDAGNILQPALAHGQLVGGAAQGIGSALLERLVYDQQGQLLTGSFMDYALPRADQMPPIEIESLCSPSPLNPLGAKGVGEAGCIGVPAAILNAARDALSPIGEFDLQFPLLPEQLWRILMQANESSSKRPQ
jgi:aerobic carbon-monoxide dehydrogenase large subunit